MANFYQQAEQQLAPVYDQQINQLQGQVPAIQNLYNTLTQALQQQNQMQLQSGVQNIVEDASARGVLRSTLPVDARQALTAQLGAALNQSLGQLGLQQGQDVSRIQEQVGGLRVSRAGAIAELARSLEGQDLERQKLELQRQQAEREYQLKQQELQIARSQAARSGGGSSRAPTQFEMTQQAASALSRELRAVAGRDGYVSPQDYAAARQEWTSAGFSAKQFEDYFSGFKNPQNKNYKYF